MNEDVRDDNEAAPGRGNIPVPDAHGQAALLLVESLIHGLIARRVLSLADALEIVSVAAEVKEVIADDMGDTPTTLRVSLALLAMMRESLRLDDTEVSR